MTSVTSSTPVLTPAGRRDSRAARRAPGRPRTARYALWFVAPFVVLFVGVYVAPICYAIYQSLFRIERDPLGLTPPTEVLDPLFNYAAVLQDAAFVASLGRVLLFGAVQVPLMLGFALALALLIDSASARGKGFFRLASFAPYAVPTVVSALMWSFLYSPTNSPINRLLEPAGITVDFLGADLTLWSVANVVTWGWTGYNMIIIYAALQGIPGEVLEAARLDGASPWRTAWHVKVPLVRPAILLTAVFSIIGSAQLYNEPFVLSSSTGTIGPQYTPLMAAQSSITAANYPYAAAQSVVLALGVAVLSVLFFRLTSRRSS
ncbi:carbohydrate ABC transporter permease [Isoptericola cucumis]|uniref:Sugar ABC transporter permease n=1 Tax=Isoptericola cucumis TaxID=1776856 RepID=A0ABQ2B5T6_9MICO|nr:sugar ABC transporter permease [Isoptericola cucumis]GGI06299.1 sugar ABC transporter permease [Isoptericola cucumis]